MELQRIRREISEALQYFPNIETVPTGTGEVYAKLMLQTSAPRVYFVDMMFTDYPLVMPSIYVRKPEISHFVHRYSNGKLCYMHPNMWNPGRHSIRDVIMRVAKWLNKHEVYLQTGKWPGAEIIH